MNKNRKKETLALNKLKYIFLLIYVTVSTVGVFATDNGIFDALDNSSQTLIDRATTTFDKSIFPIALLILFISIAFAGTNDRLLGALKTAIKWLIIVFIGLNCINIIINTLLWIVDLFNGSSTVSVSCSMGVFPRFLSIK